MCVCVCAQARTKSALKRIQITFTSGFCKAELLSPRSAEKLWLLSKLEFSWIVPLKFFFRNKISHLSDLIVKLYYIFPLFVIK
jgi:hypothetical protein